MIRRAVRWMSERAPVLIDVAAFILIIIGSIRLFGDWAWLIAGALLVIAGIVSGD